MALGVPILKHFRVTEKKKKKHTHTKKVKHHTNLDSEYTEGIWIQPLGSITILQGR